MEVVSENTNIILNNKEIYSADYSNGEGDKDEKESGKGAENFKKGLQFAKDSGLLDLGASALKNMAARKGGAPPKKGTPPPPARKPSPSPKPSAPKKGLSMGAKIGIGIGVVALLGTVIYFVTRNKK